MIDGIRFKVCGITSLVDADFADLCGADYLGFVLHPQSPRCISLTQFQAMGPRLPGRRKVAVSVEPSIDELAAMRAAGFDYFQIHFRPELPSEQLDAWSRTVGRKHLWLAPRLPPAKEIPAAALTAARFLLVDTFHPGGFGGSGKIGDWENFRRQQSAHPENFWILAGGLSPENIGDALRTSGARFVDVNSGVESAPGVKDHTKLKAFAVKLHHAVA